MSASEPRPEERRRYARVELDEEPLSAKLDDVEVQVVELSVVGFRIAHESRFPPVAGTRSILLRWKNRPMRFTCEIVRSTLHSIARSAGEKSVYHSGIRIIEAEGDSELVLRDFIAERVIKALREQKANARGEPPSLSTYRYKVGKTNRYRRCELVDGKWKKLETTRVEQPANGFTIAAEIDAHSVDLLCDTFAKSDDKGRRLTQVLAELSIRKDDDTPVRRYVP